MGERVVLGVGVFVALLVTVGDAAFFVGVGLLKFFGVGEGEEMGVISPGVGV